MRVPFPPPPCPDALPETFFCQPTVTVARALLGCTLVVRPPKLSENPPENTEDVWPWQFQIVETEAYRQDDPACHAFQRRPGHIPPRAQRLYGAPGLAYVYLIYGMYSCLNVVTEPEGTAGAVLFRALMPLWVPSSWQGNTRGPGRLTRALGLDYRQHDGLPFTQAAGPFFLAAGPAVPDAAVEAGPRIGIRHATDRPWRFYIRDNPWVSAAK